jgi:hypothetical protein
MLWTLGCAISLGLYRALTLDQRSDDNFTVGLQYFGLLYSLPAGARIGAVLLFGWMYFRGDRSFPIQPGHWLLLNEGFSLLLSWLGRCAMLLLRDDQRLGIELFLIAQIPNCLVTTIAYGVALRFSRGESRLWKGVFWLLLLLHAVAALVAGVLALRLFADQGTGYGGLMFQLYDLQYSCCPMVLLVALPIAALADSQRHQRDFLHWTGIAAILATYLLNVGGRWIIFYWR